MVSKLSGVHCSTLYLVANEFHFLKICPAYDYLRTGLPIASNVEFLDPKIQFSSNMISENAAVVRFVVQLIFYVKKLRDSFYFVAETQLLFSKTT